MQAGISRIAQMGEESINCLNDGFRHVGIATQVMVKRRGVERAMMMAVIKYVVRAVNGSGACSAQGASSASFLASFTRRHENSFL